jgi:hypothetical protein
MYTSFLLLVSVGLVSVWHCHLPISMVGLTVHVLFSAMEAMVDVLCDFLSYGGHVTQPSMCFKRKYTAKAINVIGK